MYDHRPLSKDQCKEGMEGKRNPMSNTNELDIHINWFTEGLAALHSPLVYRWVSLLIFAAIMGSVQGASYVVATTGNDSNPGTGGSPWLTIQKAANTMVAGDTVTVMAGSYASQRVTVNTSGTALNRITYQASGTVVMKGWVVEASYITIAGFEVANTAYIRADRTTGAGFYIHGASNVINGNYIHDCSLTGIHLQGRPSDPSTTVNNLISSNRVYHCSMVGIEIHGMNNTAIGNEVWETCQCLASVRAVEDVAPDNPNGLPCPNYPALNYLDADGFRVFGIGHLLQSNYIHDILFRQPGVNFITGDLNDAPHIDGFQTWTNDTYNEALEDTIFDGNLIENAQLDASGAYGQGFMLQKENGSTAPNNLTVRNNIVKAYVGMNINIANNLSIVNNVFINDLTLSDARFPSGINFGTVTLSNIRNNIFYDQMSHNVALLDVTSQGAGNVTGKNMEYRYDGLPLVTNNDYYSLARRNADFWGINPMFVAPSSGNYQLQAGSPAMNAGFNLGSLVPNDYAGNPRPATGNYDIGAYQNFTSVAVKLGFSAQPSNVTAGSTISPAVTVSAYNSANQVVNSYTGNITVAIGNNPAGGTLSGTLTKAAFGGIATFSNLSINNAGPGYTLVATAAGLTSATSSSFNVTAPTPPTPGVPILLTPTNNATGQTTTPTLDWNNSPNATSYDVQVATDAGFTSIVSGQTNQTATSFVPVPALLANTTYYWRARGRNSGGVSAFATAFSFSTALPAPAVPPLISPADGATGVALNPTLSWSAVSFASSYRIQVATDSGFSSVILDQTQTSTSAAPSLAVSTTYYWHVRAQNATGNSAYAATRSFTTSPPPAPSSPALTAPANGASDQSITPTLSWSAAATATSYRVQVATDAGFGAVVYDQSGLTSLSTIPTLSNGTLYHWHVNASNAGGTSAYSGTRTFTTIAAVPAAPAAPTLATPADAAVGQALVPTLTWNASTGATSYRIQVATDAGFVTVVVDQAGLTSTSYAPTLSGLTTYWWKVNANNAGGTSAYSTARSFTTIADGNPEPPGVAILVAPADQAVNQAVSSLLLDWNPVFSASSYTVQVSTSPVFASFAVNISGIATDSYTVNGLANGTLYYWRISASNSFGTGGYSEVSSFTTIAAIPAAPALSSPANAATGQATSPTLTWSASSGATSYGLQIATDAGFGAVVLTLTGIASTTYVPTLSAGTTYFWHVNATSSGGTSSYSTARSFSTVPTVPAAPTLTAPADAAVGQSVTPTLAWSSSSGATSYGIQVATDAAFTMLVVNLDNLAGTSYVPSLATATTYWWKVRAANTGGTSSYSAARAFSTIPAVPVAPTPLTPANGSVNQSVNPALTWRASPGATSYRLQVSTSPVFATTVVDVNGLGVLTYYPALVNATTYYWRVLANNTGGSSGFSSALNFTTQAVTPPSNPPIMSGKATLLMLIDRSGNMFKSLTSITNSSEELLRHYSLYVPGYWMTNEVAQSLANVFP